MRVPWKIVGLAGLAGVAATGVAVQQRRRSHVEYDPDALRETLHARLDATRTGAGGDAGAPGAAPAPVPEARPRPR